MSNDVLTFPPGVQSGAPFTSPVEAVTWLRDAAAGVYGPMGLAAFGGFAGPWTMAPIVADDIPTSTYTFTGPIAPSDPWTCGSTMTGIYFRRQDNAGTDDDAPPLFAFTDEFVNIAVGISPVAWLDYWRTVAGYEKTARARLKSAKSRAKAAAVLGDIETVLEDTGRHLVTAVNRWVTTVWADAVAARLEVTPNPINPAPTIPAATWQLGT